MFYAKLALFEEMAMLYLSAAIMVESISEYNGPYN